MVQSVVVCVSMCEWVCQKSLLCYSTAATTDSPPPPCLSECVCVHTCWLACLSGFRQATPSQSRPLWMLFVQQWKECSQCRNAGLRASTALTKTCSELAALLPKDNHVHRCSCLCHSCRIFYPPRMAVMKGGYAFYPHLQSVCKKKKKVINTMSDCNMESFEFWSFG